MLKDRVCTTPILEIYDGSADTVVELYTDASAQALGTVLLEQRPGQPSFHPVVYYSRKFNTAQ